MNILHNPEQRRFTLTQNGETAHVAYLIENGALDIRHTIVPKPLEGRGIASALVLAALGVDEESVLYDYSLSNHYFDIPTASSYAYHLPVPSQEALTTIYSAREAFLNAAKDEIERTYGGVDEYLRKAVGLQKEEMQQLRKILLVDEE